MHAIRLAAFSLACLAGLLVPASAQADTRDAAFRILRKGTPIGHHVVDVEQIGDTIRVDTKIAMRVKFGPLVVYRYDHLSRETWSGGQLTAIESTTNDNGKKAQLRVTRDGDQLQVDGTNYRGPAPLNATPSSYWNRNIVGASLLLNTQNGELIEVTTSRIGVTPAPGGEPAEQFLIVGSLALNLWYSGDIWVGSNFTVDGEELTYVPIKQSEERGRIIAQLEATSD
jgi:hypothetical protein